MSRLINPFIALCLLTATNFGWAQTGSKSIDTYVGIGRAATAKELAAWDIDVRPDFRGLPPGTGSVAKGQEIWEAKCSSCHGVFGESNEVFSPLVGGTTADDVKTGRVARLLDGSYPGRTTLMKVASLSTLWDYINRAMPWTQPKSLTADEVYSVTAFLLNLGGVIPDDFVLSQKNMAEVQGRMPNRNGMTVAHALWPGTELSGKAKPDIKAVDCMKNCSVDPKVASFLPDFARNAHGNLADQNRGVGAQRGAMTDQPEVLLGTKAGPIMTAAVATTAQGATPPRASPSASSLDIKAIKALANKYSCTACHGMTQKIVGPSFADIAKKYPDRAEYLAEKVKSGGLGVWGAIPMPPQALTAAEAKLIAMWLATGAGQ